MTQSSEELLVHKEAKALYNEGKRPVGRPPDFDTRIRKAVDQKETAEKALETAEKHRESVSQAIKGIGEVYHPYDLETGVQRSPKDLSSAIESHFSTIEQEKSDKSKINCSKSLKYIPKISINSKG